MKLTKQRTNIMKLTKQRLKQIIREELQREVSGENAIDPMEIANIPLFEEQMTEELSTAAQIAIGIPIGIMAWKVGWGMLAALARAVLKGNGAIGAAAVKQVLESFKAGGLKEDAQEFFMNELDEEERAAMMELTNDKEFEEYIGAAIAGVAGIMEAANSNDEGEFARAKIMLELSLAQVATKMEDAGLSPEGVAAGKVAYLDRINAIWQGNLETALNKPSADNYRTQRDRAAQVMGR
jgi:hypothetical protein